MKEEIVTIIVAIIGSGVLNTLITAAMTEREKKKNENCEVQNAIRLVMKDRLRFLCSHYIDQGWIYEDELEDLISMHNCYHNDLKGNGYLDELMKRVKNLEIKGIGVK